jgi:hypothetical protein
MSQDPRHEGGGWGKVLTLLAIWGVLVVLVLLALAPAGVPRSKAGWIALVVLGPPAYILLEGFGQKFLDRDVGQLFTRVPRSPLGRVVYALVILLLLIAAMKYGAWIWRHLGG